MWSVFKCRRRRESQLPHYLISFLRFNGLLPHHTLHITHITTTNKRLHAAHTRRDERIHASHSKRLERKTKPRKQTKLPGEKCLKEPPIHLIAFIFFLHHAQNNFISNVKREDEKYHHVYGQLWKHVETPLEELEVVEDAINNLTNSSNSAYAGPRYMEDWIGRFTLTRVSTSHSPLVLPPKNIDIVCAQ